MPKVVPSQVVKLIDKLFPRQHFSNPSMGLSTDQAKKFLAILNLVRQIPSELFNLNENKYSDLQTGLAEIEYAISNWKNITLRDTVKLEAIMLIKDALSRCPDEFPSETTHELNFLEPDLRDNLRIDISSIHQCLVDGLWKATTVLAGSVIEALLLWALGKCPEAKVQDSINSYWTSKGLTKGKPSASNLISCKWSFNLYIEIISLLSIMSENTITQINLTRNFRNLIHPAVEKRKEQKCDKATAYSTVAGVEHVVRDLEVWAQTGYPV